MNIIRVLALLVMLFSPFARADIGTEFPGKIGNVGWHPKLEESVTSESFWVSVDVTFFLEKYPPQVILEVNGKATVLPIEAGKASARVDLAVGENKILVYLENRLGARVDTREFKARREAFPDEFNVLAKALGCIPQAHKGYAWGLFEAPQAKESAVFWCKYPGEKSQCSGEAASIVVFVRGVEKAKARRKKYCDFSIRSQCMLQSDLRILDSVAARAENISPDLKAFYSLGASGSEKGRRSGTVNGPIILNPTSSGTHSVYVCDPQTKTWFQADAC